MTRYALFADMGGQIVVRDHEIVDGAVMAMAAGNDPFFNAPFVDAIEMFRAKKIMSEKEYEDLWDRYREEGFYAAELASKRAANLAKDVITQALEGSLTTDEAVKELMGVSPTSSRAYLETVVRTNVASAYGAGRWRQIKNPVVMKLRPFVQYRTARDTRVRDAHRVLEGRVFETDSDLAATYAPPLGYNCRCQYVTLSTRQVDGRGLEVSRDAPTYPETDPVEHRRGQPVKPDEGFEGVPDEGSNPGR